jgi:hypothetical protein
VAELEFPAEAAFASDVLLRLAKTPGAATIAELSRVTQAPIDAVRSFVDTLSEQGWMSAFEEERKPEARPGAIRFERNPIEILETGESKSSVELGLDAYLEGDAIAEMALGTPLFAGHPRHYWHLQCLPEPTTLELLAGAIAVLVVPAAHAYKLDPFTDAPETSSIFVENMSDEDRDAFADYVGSSWKTLRKGEAESLPAGAWLTVRVLEPAAWRLEKRMGARQIPAPRRGWMLRDALEAPRIDLEGPDRYALAAKTHVVRAIVPGSAERLMLVATDLIVAELDFARDDPALIVLATIASAGPATGASLAAVIEDKDALRRALGSLLLHGWLSRARS